MDTPAAPDPQPTPASRPYPPYRPWLSLLCVVFVVATFLMILLGGQVTSEDAGMAVPDGFTTFGEWSLIASLEKWYYQRDTFLEHSHRLLGYVVGCVAIGVMVGFLLTQGQRRWVKALGIVLLICVIIQGTLGILRVDENSPFLAGVHGVTAQILLCLMVLAAASVGRYWMTRPHPRNRSRNGPATEHRHKPSFRILPFVLLTLLLIQLVLGAAVRHSQSALAIPDWPTHYGQVMPPMSQPDIDAAVARHPGTQAPRFDPDGDGTYQAWQVHTHFAHRLGAYVTFAFGVWLVAYLCRSYRGKGKVVIPAVLVGVLLLLQVALGVYTVWSGERPIIATLHQSNGALLLAAATWLTIRLHLTPLPDTRAEGVPFGAGDALRIAANPSPTTPTPNQTKPRPA